MAVFWVVAPRILNWPTFQRCLLPPSSYTSPWEPKIPRGMSSPRCYLKLYLWTNLVTYFVICYNRKLIIKFTVKTYLDTGLTRCSCITQLCSLHLDPYQPPLYKTDWWIYTRCPKKMYTHKVNIPYYNMYTSFWNTLYIYKIQLFSLQVFQSVRDVIFPVLN
jgi:hypothetical protein